MNENAIVNCWIILSKESDGGNTKRIKWCCVDKRKSLLDFVQYLLDSVNDISKFYIIHIQENGNCSKEHSVEKLAGILGMKKRTFDERMKNTKTYNNIGEMIVKNDKSV